MSLYTGYTDKNGTIATATLMSQVETKIGNEISTSQTSIQEWADAKFAAISLESTVDEIGGHLTVSNYSIYMYADKGDARGGYIGLSASAVTIGSPSVNTTLYGDEIHLNGETYLSSSNTYFGGRKINHGNFTDKYDDVFDVLYLKQQ